jgi:lipopolysaccharide export system protein LptA
MFDLAKRSVHVEGNVRLFLDSTRLGATPGADDTEPGTEGARDLLALESDAPLSIRSDRLEAFDRQGRREIVFDGNVEVVRSDVILRSERLEAIYTDPQRQPERLVATGHVTVTQGEREARCERAVYFSAGDRLECAGDAELRDGEDRVRGEMIAFDLEAETVVVKGRTRLLFHPEQDPTEVAIP